jgi:hypothetical protein
MKALVALAILAAMPVGAQVTYDYAGQAMTLTGVAGSASTGSQTYTMSYSVLGDVVLAQALNPNQANQQVVPLAYAFNDPGLLPPGTGLNTVSGLLNYNVNDPYSSPLTPVGPNPDPLGRGDPYPRLLDSQREDHIIWHDLWWLVPLRSRNADAQQRGGQLQFECISARLQLRWKLEWLEFGGWNLGAGT